MGASEEHAGGVGFQAIQSNRFYGSKDDVEARLRDQTIVANFHCAESDVEADYSAVRAVKRDGEVGVANGRLDDGHFLLLVLGTVRSGSNADFALEDGGVKRDSVGRERARGSGRARRAGRRASSIPGSSAVEGEVNLRSS